jgi:5-methylcytosine-specific restriction endonuclease McrA
MPMRAPRICACGRRVPQDVRCQCQKQRDRLADASRPSASLRGYDSEWRALSKAFLAESGNDRCACGAPAVLVAHRISIRKAPHLRLDRSNWMPSCQACNLRQNIRCEGGFGRKREVP